MDKRIAGLLGAVAGVASVNSAQAAPQPATNAAEALQAATYAELLTPIPNALAMLQEDDANRAQRPASEGVRVAQAHHHHHHHHHSEYFAVPRAEG